jgi:hypothetical protein
MVVVTLLIATSHQRVLFKQSQCSAIIRTSDQGPKERHLYGAMLKPVSKIVESDEDDKKFMPLQVIPTSCFLHLCFHWYQANIPLTNENYSQRLLSSRVGAPGLWLEEMTTQLWTTDQG